MRVLITGGTGFIGSSLVEALLARGDDVVILSRTAHEDTQRCRFIRSLDDLPVTVEIDAIVNMAGASLAARRWSSSYKEEILASRMNTTRALLNLIARLDHPPKALISASAIGYYGHHGDERLIESSPVTPGFAQKLCSNWESLALQAQQAGVRVCLLRLGVVLGRGGGALQEMKKSFHLGVASWLGSGAQWLSWVHRRDVIKAILFLLGRDDLHGPFNLTSPQPVTGRDFCTALQAHHRTFFRVGVPAPVMKLVVGEMAEELLLKGQRVLPEGLKISGFNFDYPDLASALSEIYQTDAT